jgi:outer membrane biosynthesis protein TonB
VLSPSPEPPEPKPARPRTVAEARAAKGLPPSEKMRQEGGVQRRDIQSTLDVQATAYGDYDAQIINAIRSRWYSLLSGKHSPVGKVVVEFKLHANGTISELRTIDANVDNLFQYLCEAAIQEPSPYQKWPVEMRRVLGGDSREVRFTFFYN